MFDAQPVDKIVMDSFLPFFKMDFLWFGFHFQIDKAITLYRVAHESIHFIDYGAHIDFKDWL